LLSQQILDYGDWAVKNRQGKPGAWAFEFDNRFYPDVDDTAVVVMALEAIALPHEELKRNAIARAVNWIGSMQCRTGGWAAFDLDNDSDWLNSLPYGDLKAMIDPNTADVTARVLEMVGCLQGERERGREGGQGGQGGKGKGKFPNSTLNTQHLTLSLEQAIAYLLAEQEPEGCWFGRWGVNYIYGTSGVLSALSLVAPQRSRLNIEGGAAWLVGCQNPDGGWGETCRSYDDPSLKGKGVSTPSQTAWAVIGLIAAGEATGQMAEDAIARGISYLLETQQLNGTWNESEFTGTGFPGHFYLKYHLYQQYFPLIALGRYRKNYAGG
jgi:squalene-hopene/tetraprenyl-beta-curcumene cyclase